VPTWFSRTPGRVAGAAPLLGEDTDQVLAELGLADVEAAESV
jgi:crotonobetainyl-CoA:carnitine CoA-transferase CaiB-like acyl-CoA transferase